MSGEYKAPLNQSKNTSLTTFDEANFKKDMNVGVEGLSPEDFPTPTLNLVQTNSTLVDSDNRPLPRGSFYYKGTQETFNEVNCSVLSITKKDLPDFSDREQMVTNYVLFGVISPGFKPFLMYLKRSGIGAAKDLLGQVRAAQKPMYALAVKITADLKQGEKGSYYVSKFKVLGTRGEQELPILQKLAKTYSQQSQDEPVYEEPQEPTQSKMEVLEDETPYDERDVEPEVKSSGIPF